MATKPKTPLGRKARKKKFGGMAKSLSGSSAIPRKLGPTVPDDGKADTGDPEDDDDEKQDGSPAVVNKLGDDISSEVMEQRNSSMRWFNANYYEEFREVYRNVNARTKPMMKKNAQGEEVEDDTRTNVCLPDHHVMVRRGVARLTRNAPNLRVRGGTDQATRDKVSGLLMHQWDRGEMQKPFRQIVLSAKMLGWGVGATYWDKVVVNRAFRRITMKLTKPDMMRVQGAPQDEIDDATAQPAEQQQPSSDEIQQMIAKYGDQVVVPTDVTKYEGPVLADCFIGDVYPEPGFRTLNESAFVDLYQERDDQWLAYWQKQTSIDPETQEESPVLDAKACQELLDMAPSTTNATSGGGNQAMNLRRQMREAIGVADPRYSSTAVKISKKRFMVDHRHSMINGRGCIDFVGADSIYLGRMWYPWNTYGRYTFTEMILIPDLLGGIGQSTTRITRFLMQLRNARVNQTTDFINNKLLPFFKHLSTLDITNEDLVRTAWGRFLAVPSMGAVEPFEDPPFPAEAFGDQQQYQREMQQAEPAIADFSPGTETSPQAGRLATTAVLQQKASDAVLADELNCLGHFTRETVELMLWMNQQQLQKPVTVDQGVQRRVSQMGQGQ